MSVLEEDAAAERHICRLLLVMDIPPLTAQALALPQFNPHRRQLAT